jgi:hypothetical protein
MTKSILISSILSLVILLAAASAYFLYFRQNQPPKSKDKIAQIEQALAAKNRWDEGKAEVVLQKDMGDYATGETKLTDSQTGGGVWFAAKVDGEWKIVWDGIGSVMCADLEQYPNYPSELIAECYDIKSGKIVVR